MVSFFWQKGFYFNGRILFFKQLSFYKLGCLFGLSKTFINFWLLRCEGLVHVRSNQFLLSTVSKTTNLSKLTSQETFLFNVYLSQTFPVLLNVHSQLRFNMWFYFITKTYKGIALRINKPIKRRSRARTYINSQMARPRTLYKLKTSTSSWF